MRRMGSRLRFRYLLPWVGLAMFGLAAAGGALLGATLGYPSSAPSAGPTSPPTSPAFSTVPVSGFGGYQASGPVTEIAADWVVPQIAAGSPLGQASTWIGASDPAGDFIQVGTLESQVPGDPGGFYLGFWSSTAEGFHPQILEPVAPGDTVAAEMVQGPNGWVLTLRDTRASVDHVLPTGYGAGKRFNLSDWTQEDPVASVSRPPLDLPFPAISTVVFSHLRLDGAVPRLSFAHARALSSPNGTALVPTVPSNDGFALHAADHDQLQYLMDVRDLNLASEQLAAALGTQSQAAAAANYSYLLMSASLDMTTQTWPDAVARQIPDFVRQADSLSREMAALERPGPGAHGPLAALVADSSGLSRVGKEIRRALGLPPG